jgi:hypothetical protein
MGHYCKICGCVRPNEKFSGRGHKNHICKECASLPKEKIEAIGFEEEIFGYMSQSHISEKNIARLKIISQSPNNRVSHLALVALEVAAVKPHKRSRINFLARGHKELLEKLEKTGLIHAHGMN